MTERFDYEQALADIKAGQQLNWLLDGYDVSKLHPHASRQYNSAI